jgi:multidrug resistance efflux pump
MRLRTFAVLPPLVLALGLAACDSRDYEGEIATLQGDLDTARTELEEAQSQNEQLTTEVEELRAQSEQAGTGDPAALEPVQSEFNAIVEKASVSLANLTQLEAQPDAPAELGDLRQNMQDIMQSVQTVAGELGLEVAPAPAAGPEQGGAAQGAPPETEAQPETEAHPTGEGEQAEEPAQQQ